MKPRTPAVVWADRVTAARAAEFRARAEADAILEEPDRLDDPWWPAVTSTRYQAAKQVERAYREYAEQAEAAFQQNAEAEMAATDARDARHHRYDAVPGVYSRAHAEGLEGKRPCRHGCCLTAVCEFAGCDHGSYTDVEVGRFYADGAA